MIIAEIHCNRTNEIHTCVLKTLRKRGETNAKVMVKACLDCASSGARLTSAGLTRSKKGINHLYKDATTLEEFKDETHDN